MFGKWDIFDLIKAFFRFLVAVAVGAVCTVLVWRVVASSVPKDLCQISMNDPLNEAYAEKGDGLLLYTQEQNSITRGESNYGYFTSCDVLFIPEANQIQLLIRYNDSTLKALQKDYGLAELPDSAEDWYDVTLVTATDLTPENQEDNLASDPASVRLDRIAPTYVSESVHKGLYSYRRLVYDGVEMDELLLAFYADFYYVGDIRYLDEGFDIYTDEAYGTLCLYAHTEPLEEVSHRKVGLGK